jgi:hypothetical protein
MDAASASFAGVVAGSVVAIAFVVGRSRGLSADTEMMLGTLVVARSPSVAWLVGAAMSIVTSGCVGLLYAIGFEYVTKGSGIVAGVGLAVVHTVISGLGLALLPVVHPLMRIDVSAKPGVFKRHLGLPDMSAFVVLHLLFGALVGSLYR